MLVERFCPLDKRLPDAFLEIYSRAEVEYFLTNPVWNRRNGTGPFWRCDHSSLHTFTNILDGVLLKQTGSLLLMRQGQLASIQSNMEGGLDIGNQELLFWSPNKLSLFSLATGRCKELYFSGPDGKILKLVGYSHEWSGNHSSSNQIANCATSVVDILLSNSAIEAPTLHVRRGQTAGK